MRRKMHMAEDLLLNDETRTPKKLRFLHSPFIWAGTTYFAEGFPYSLVRQISSVFFKDHQASLQAIGMTSLLGLPWTLKFLWSPYLDRFGTKRRWLLWLQVLLVLAIFCFAFASHSSMALPLGTLSFVLIALVSATHDIAVDGFYLEALDRRGQARFVGYRVMAYRIAMIAGAGGIVALSHYVRWWGAFSCAGVIILMLLLYHLFFLPRVEVERFPIRDLFLRLSWRRDLGILFVFVSLGTLCVYVLHTENVQGFFVSLAPFVERLTLPGWVGLLLLLVLLTLLCLRNRIRASLYRSDSLYAKAFLSFLDQERIGWALVFIVLYRSGESLLLSMCVPFLMDLGINKAQYGFISGTLGILCSILGALVGGACIGHFSLKRTIWPFTLAQNLTLLLYMGMAYYYRDLVQHALGGEVSLLLVGSVHCFEQFAGGLGTAVFSFYLMRCCKPDFKASHFAIVSGIMNVGGSLLGVMSGFLASLVGYWRFFGVSFLVSIPGMLLIFFVPFLDEQSQS
jgi:PAT family beta-lactamase induction signal transducer AmpG